MYTWTDIPDQYRSRITIQYQNINTFVFADETYGYWLYLGGQMGCSNFNCTSTYSTLFLERERGTNFPNTPGVAISCDSRQTGCTNSGLPTNEIVPLASSTAPYATSPITLGTKPSLCGVLRHLCGRHDNATLAEFDHSARTVHGGTQFRQRLYRSVVGEDRAGNPASHVGDGRRQTRYAVWREPLRFRLRAARSERRSARASLANTSLPGVAAAWLAQAGMASSLSDGINQTLSQEHHTLAVVYDESVVDNMPSSRLAINATRRHEHRQPQRKQHGPPICVQYSGDRL